MPYCKCIWSVCVQIQAIQMPAQGFLYYCVIIRKYYVYGRSHSPLFTPDARTEIDAF